MFVAGSGNPQNGGEALDGIFIDTFEPMITSQAIISSELR